MSSPLEQELLTLLEHMSSPLEQELLTLQEEQEFRSSLFWREITPGAGIPYSSGAHEFTPGAAGT